MNPKANPVISSKLLFSSSEFRNIIEGIRTLTSTLNYDELLNRILEIALTVIPLSTSGIFRLFDEKRQLLIPLAYVGNIASSLLHNTRRGESLSGKVFDDGIARIYNMNDMLDELEHLSPENQNFRNKLLTDEQYIARSMISVPVTIRGERRGTLTLHRFDDEGLFTAYDLELLKVFADQVAIAVENAKLYSEVQNVLQEVTELSGQIQENNQILQKRLEVHEALTALSLKNKGIHAIVKELNRMIKMPASFVDMLNKHSHNGNSQQIQLEFDDIAGLWDTEDHVPLTISFHEQEFYLHPVTVDKVLLGCIMVRLTGPIASMDIVTLEQSSSLFALEMIKKLSLTDIYYKETKEIFTKLLQNQNDDALMAKGVELGLDFSGYMSVSILEITGQFELYQTEINIQRLVFKLNETFNSTPHMAFGLHNQVIMLTSFPHAADAEWVKQSMERMIQEWRFSSSKYVLSAAMGTPYKGIVNIAKSNTEAQKTLHYMFSKQQSGCIQYKDIGINRLFLGQDVSEIHQFISDILGPLESTPGHSSQLEQTLHIYMSEDKIAINTAAVLGIHINTLYQRLKKIQQVLNIRFDNKDDMLKIQMAYHLKDTFNQKH
ncbi:hypothetical protein BSK49_22205 [Paenibacillus odorifer]|uniref:GAF domain-containing protein n=1 Tax=Paenibacillus TaxID=44249 RepID=UPI00096BFCAD|nr:GAF domain-containing protein [Paenibacillus odorifer]OMD84022.1 hypothetical protein BSK49_22205 [Paenibacillus odorifer]